VLIRTDSGGTHEFLGWQATPGHRLHYSIGVIITEQMQEAIFQLPDRVWEPAYDARGRGPPGAWVAELTGLLDLSSWPEDAGDRPQRNAPTRARKRPPLSPATRCRGVNLRAACGADGCPIISIVAETRARRFRSPGYGRWRPG
jgi:hypothetical protein